MTVQIINGDCLDILAGLPDDSVHCAVTSPPYWGLRDYGVSGQLGLEATPDEYVAAIVSVFREVRRVLRDDGTLWLNLGSSYSTGVCSDVRDCMNSIIKGGSVFFADADSVAVASHGVGIPTKDKRAPDRVFPELLGSQGDCVEDRDKNFCEVADLFASPHNGSGRSASRWLSVNGSRAEMPVDALNHSSVIKTNNDPNSEPELSVLGSRSARARKYDEVSFAVHDADKPSVRQHVVWHSEWDSFAIQAIRKCSVDINLVDKAVSLRNRFDTLAGLLSDFCVTDAGEKKVTLTSVQGGLRVSVTDIGHVWFVLKCGSVVPYTALYKMASQTANEMRPKQDLCIPWRVATALQRDGWILRSSIIWHKPNPMPESVTDRPTKSHEYIFLFTKSARYFYDADAVREPNGGQFNRFDGVKGSLPKSADRLVCGGNDIDRCGNHPNGRNIRTVWTIATQPFSGSHFACVDEKTECLTTVGWKRHNDIVPGMLAAQFDTTTQTLSWGHVEAIASYDVSGQDMIVGSCRDMDMWLTPNHRTVVRRRDCRTRQYQKPIIINADELKASHSIPTAADWVPHGDTSVSLEWAELLGWYVSEGHESKDSLAVELYQSESVNGDKCRRIEHLLRQVGAEWSKTTCKRTWKCRAADLNAYRIMGYAAARLREMAPGKILPWSTLLWSNDRIVSLVDGLIKGDGHTRLDGRRMFVQKNISQCDLMQALIMRLGYSATVSQRADGIGHVYITSHRTRSFRGTNGRGSPPVLRKYTGIIWCPKLPNGTWVARRNGKPFITGNTFPPKLVETCIKAGTSERGCCPACGAPWARVVEANASANKRNEIIADYDVGGIKKGSSADRARRLDGKNYEHVRKPTNTWNHSCTCPPHQPVPCTVLDCFSGAGTVGMVADRLQRDAILIELNPDYVEMARQRIASDAPLLVCPT